MSHNAESQKPRTTSSPLAYIPILTGFTCNTPPSRRIQQPGTMTAVITATFLGLLCSRVGLVRIGDKLSSRGNHNDHDSPPHPPLPIPGPRAIRLYGLRYVDSILYVSVVEGTTQVFTLPFRPLPRAPATTFFSRRRENFLLCFMSLDLVVSFGDIWGAAPLPPSVGALGEFGTRLRAHVATVDDSCPLFGVSTSRFGNSNIVPQYAVWC